MKHMPHWKFSFWLTGYIGWMGVIFGLSSQPYSQQTLIPQLQQLFSLQFLLQWLPDWHFMFGKSEISLDNPYYFVEFFIRKASHVCAFMILTLIGFAVYRYVNKRIMTIVVLGCCTSLGYAIFDEWHQSWVPDRTGQWRDVLVDAIGILLAWILFLALKRFRRKKSPYG